MTYVYDFRHGDGTAKDLLGGKGAGLAEMTRLGLPVPPGFTVSTDACRAYMKDGRFPAGLWDEIVAAVHRLETRTGRNFGDGVGTPLLLSVRSGAKFSMPGMMDTVLNLGLNDEVVQRLERWAGNAWFAWDAYRRFVQTYAKVVTDVPGAAFEQVLTELRTERGAATDAELTAADLETATRRFQDIVTERAGSPVPRDPAKQLLDAATAVFNSWNNRRARSYRRIHGISDELGTAVNVQTMVFGDLDEESGTGVCFTRNPSTGENVPYGDYLPNSQGEDVVAGIRRTLSLDELKSRHPGHHAQLAKIMQTLERDYRDMCDIEFTIERDQLWILQTRVAKRAAAAAIRIATEMVDEGLIDEKEAVLRVEPESLEQLLHPRLPDDVDAAPLAVGLNASPGAAVGQAVFDADVAVEWRKAGKKVILVRWETTPDDIHGMVVAEGILTSHGGKTSHAAVVARGMGTPAVTGAEQVAVDESTRSFSVGGVTVGEGQVITIDGTTGRIYLGPIDLIEPDPTPELERLLSWADGYRRLGIRANADTPDDAERARNWGAEGIGLARTEHMFLGSRLPIVRSLILTGESIERKDALEALRRFQAADFEGILEAMDGMPVIVRLLDPPLHEFLPDRWDLEADRVDLLLAGEPTTEVDHLMREVARWEESNPMLGMRGVRLGLVMPDIYRMQVGAALEAVAARQAAGGDPKLELMIPLVSTAEELHRQRLMIEDEIEAARAAFGRDPGVKIGTMIETPRAALTAAEVAAEAEFFSFGTNDLTQMTFGLSRDDAEGKFLTRYLADGVLAANPFASLDRRGVGKLVQMATTDGKTANPRLEVGVCGEHGGDPVSIAFWHEAGLDYVSCSPPRVPIARLAAAQAAIDGTSVSSSV